MKALLYLEYRTIVNEIRRTLRSPRRLIPGLITLGMLLFLFQHRSGSPSRHAMDPRVLDLLGQHIEYVRPAVFGLVTLLSSLILTAALGQSLIAFRQNELDYLVPSGLDRRLIMGSKLLGLMSKVLGLPAVFAIMWLPSVRSVLAGKGAVVWPAFIGFCAFGFFFLSLYTLVNLIGAYRPGGKWWASLLVRGLAVSAVGFPFILALGGWLLAGNPLVYLLPALRSPITTTAFFPVKWLTDLLLAVVTGWSPVLTAELAGLVLLAGVVFAATISRKENPYEPSLTSSAGLVAVMVASHSGELQALAARVRDAELRKIKPARTSIPPFGRGAWAFVWKSAVSTRRGYFNACVGILLVIVVLIAVPKIVMAALGEHSDSTPSAMVALCLLPILIMFGSLAAMHELRADLKQANIVKPMPIAAWQIMAAETAHATGLLSLAAWVVLAELAALYGVPHNGSMLVIALTVPFVIAACSCVQVPISVIYPDWEEATSQSTGSGLTILLTVSVLGFSLLIGTGLWGLGLWRPAVALALILFCSAMSIAGTAVGTFLFQRYDPTNE